MKAKTIEAVEIRGKEKKTSKTGNDYLIVRAEDDTGKTYEIIDRDLSRMDEYRKGRQVRLTLYIDLGRYKNVEIVGIEEG